MFLETPSLAHKVHIPKNKRRYQATQSRLAHTLEHNTYDLHPFQLI